MRMSDWSSDVYSSDLRRELDDRRASILASIEEQGKLTPGLAREINLADTKTRLEDLYLPYKQKRRTNGQIALEAGLGELADALFGNPDLTPEQQAERFVDAEKGFPDAKAALAGAQYLRIDRLATHADQLPKLRPCPQPNPPPPPPSSP